MNDPLVISTITCMLLVIALLSLITTVLAVVAVRYLGIIVDQGRDARSGDKRPEDMMTLSATTYSPKRPEGMKTAECGHGGVHMSHTWRPPTSALAGRGENGKLIREEPKPAPLTWCPGMSQAQSDEADRLAKREEEMFHPDTSRHEVPCSRVDAHAPHEGKITHTDKSTAWVRCPGRA